MNSRTLALLLIVLLCAVASPAAALEDFRFAERLTKIMGEEVSYAKLSPDGGYAAVVLEKDVALTTSAGKVIWRRPLKLVNRYLTDLEIRAAAGPGGRHFAISGGPSFRKVLLLDAQGKAQAYLSTRGTPRGLAFDPAGKRLAVGTASGSLYVISLAAERDNRPLHVFPSSAVRGHPLNGLIEEVGYSPDGRYVCTTFSGGTIALLTGSGSLLWSRKVNYYADFRASKDWRWFTVCEVPSHGPFYGSVSLLNHAGKRLWSRPYRGPQAAVSPDHQFVLMRAASPEVVAEPEVNSPVSWRVADWKGRELPRNDRGDSSRFVAPGGIVLTVRDLTWTATRNGRTLWTMKTDFPDSDAAYREALEEPGKPESP